MSEENKQKENKEEKVEVKIQGREFELTKLTKGGYGGKISFKIGDIENEDVYVEKTYLDLDENNNIYRISFPIDSPQKISFKIGGIENKAVDKTSLDFYKNGNIRNISFPIDSPQKISFKIGDIENKVDATTLFFHANGNISDIYFIKSPQKISFKIGDIENKVDATTLNFHKNGNISGIFFPGNSPQKISFKIGDIYYKLLLSQLIVFYDDSLLNYIYICEDIEDYFYYKTKKYKLSFKSGDEIDFDAMGNLQYWCVKKSQTRTQQIEEQDRIYKLENTTKKLENEQKKLADKHSVATRVDWIFVGSCAVIGCWFVFVALGLCFHKFIFPLNFIHPDNFDKMSFDYHLHFLNPEYQTFNRYAFLYEILKRAPIIVSIILGFKFLQLAFVKLRQIGEVEKVRDYIALTADDDTKKQLLKMIAIPFFAPKKVKSSFFDRLIDKLPINFPINIGGEQKSGGVISEDKQNPNKP